MNFLRIKTIGAIAYSDQNISATVSKLPAQARSKVNSELTFRGWLLLLGLS